MDTKTHSSIPATVMGPNYSYVFDFERDFEHEVTKGWFLVSFFYFLSFFFQKLNHGSLFFSFGINFFEVVDF